MRRFIQKSIQKYREEGGGVLLATGLSLMVMGVLTLFLAFYSGESDEIWVFLMEGIFFIVAAFFLLR